MIDAPFIWFGGKSRVAPLVWERFGKVENFVEPFFGSGAVLLGRPTPRGTETINDKDGLVANFWRAVKHDPEAVAAWADNPVNECDLHARHLWLLGQLPTLADRLCADPDWHDAKIAGWWCWGLCCWIGSGWCSGNGPWIAVDGVMVKGDAGQGVNRKLPHLSNGRGVNRKLPRSGLGDWMLALADRLRDVRVCCGDWSRVCGPSVTFTHGLTAVFLDPPYADEADRAADLYREDCGRLAHDVRQWAIDNGDNPLLRVALCGYEGEHTMPDSWDCVPWKAKGGYGGLSGSHDNPNARRERVWFSPHCLAARRPGLFDWAAERVAS